MYYALSDPHEEEQIMYFRLSLVKKYSRIVACFTFHCANGFTVL